MTSIGIVTDFVKFTCSRGRRRRLCILDKYMMSEGDDNSANDEFGSGWGGSLGGVALDQVFQD